MLEAVVLTHKFDSNFLFQYLIEIATRYSAEDPNTDSRQDESTKDGLQKDGILNLSQSWLGNPDLAIEDLADDVALLVPSNPGLVFEGVGGLADE